MSTSREGINKKTSNQWLCNVVTRLMLFLFHSHQMARLPLLDQVSITDKNKEKNCAQNNNRCYFIYCTLFSITLPNLANITRILTSAGRNFYSTLYFFIQGNRVSRIDLFPSMYTVSVIYEGWNFNSGNYLFTTDTK